MKAIARESEPVFAKSIGKRPGAVGSGKAPTAGFELAMEPGGNVLFGGDFDDTAQFSTVLGGKSGG